MTLDSLRLIRNILLRAAIVCYAFALLMALSTIALWDTWTALTSQWFHTAPETLGPMILYFFSAIKFYAIFILLVPGLAIHWTLKREESRKKD